MSTRHEIELKFVMADIPEQLRTKDPWQVILSVTNRHGVGVAGTMCVRINYLDKECKPFAVLPGQVNGIDFRSDRTITSIFADGGLSCFHSNKHYFGFSLDNPVNGKIYYGVIPE